ncbi:RNA 2'-phosphotransferase [Pseudomonas sp. PLMAX]|uniref:RNA 2'-phosphotransferase n=1 Tax=Pseudomonas sp. PLMAX TaxID=2201998 RepID=UPI0038B849B6
MNSKHITETSKFLSFVLRHSPESIGLELDSEGWASIGDLQNGARQQGREVDSDLLLAVVDGNEKKRFSISDDGLRIRAVQGHSAPTVNLQHVEKKPPAVLYHGTATRFMKSILAQGLLPGARHHVHLSESRETAESVGKRYGSPVILELKADAMYSAGIKFYQADNGVWLTDAVPCEFLMEPK